MKAYEVKNNTGPNWPSLYVEKIYFHKRKKVIQACSIRRQGLGHFPLTLAYHKYYHLIQDPCMDR